MSFMKGVMCDKCGTHLNWHFELDGNMTCQKCHAKANERMSRMMFDFDLLIERCMMSLDSVITKERYNFYEKLEKKFSNLRKKWK